ncbi:MAG: FAD:protein FMN transferase [Candidatus Absconditabacterales bacterium]
METYHFRKESCGSVLSIAITSSSDPAAIVRGCFSICDAFEQRYSRFIPGNWLDTINKQQEQGITLDDEASKLIKLMLEVAELTQGLFDPTVIATLEAYGYDKDYSFQKKQGGPMGYKHVQLHDNILVLHDGVRLEFGTVGKGYLLDVMKDKLIQSGIQDFVLDFGGDIYAQGGHKIGLENPFDLQQVIGTIQVDGFAVASSNGKKRAVGDFHHLLDAVTGKPVMDIAGVYIAAPSGLLADTYSTAVFVSGAQRGMELLQHTKDISGMIVFADGSYRKTYDYPGQLFE